MQARTINTRVYIRASGWWVRFRARLLRSERGYMDEIFPTPPFIGAATHSSCCGVVELRKSVKRERDANTPMVNSTEGTYALEAENDDHNGFFFSAINYCPSRSLSLSPLSLFFFALLFLSSEQKAALSLLNTWQLARPNRAAITLGGDLHLGGFTDSWVSTASRLL